MSENCNRHIDSREHKSGTFSSPNYPDNYPSDVTCQYTFQGHGQERVQIIFTHFRLRSHVDDHGDKFVYRLCFYIDLFLPVAGLFLYCEHDAHEYH